MDKVIYYRNEYLISEADKARIIALYGTREWHTFETYYWNNSCNTGLPEMVNLILYIENTRQFSERDEELRLRIEKKKPNLTFSRSTSFDTVEEKLLHELVWDAYYAYKREFGEDCEITDSDMRRLKTEFKRMYGLPNKKHIMLEVEANEAKIKDVTEPTVLYELNHVYPTQPFYVGGYDTVYKQYHIIMPEGFNEWGWKWDENKIRAMYEKFSYLGKLYYSDGWGNTSVPQWQIYVYDAIPRDWAVQNVIHAMMTFKNSDDLLELKD